MPPLSVYFKNPPDADTLTYLQSLLVDNITLTTEETPAEYDILIAGRPTQEDLDRSSRLRAVIIPFAGMPPETQKLMQGFPKITIHNLHYNAPPTAEMALTLLMAAAKWLLPTDTDFRRRNWAARHESAPAVLLQGKTALILGYGAIGQHLGTILKAMGMTVLATRRTHTNPEKGIFPADTLHELLPRANVLIVTVPGTPDTVGLIGEKELGLLPKGAIVVNVGRGPVIDQYALYNALKSGHLFGAGIDVWYHYAKDEASRASTAPADVPFHELDNIVMSPHRAGGGGSEEIEHMRMEALAEALNAAAAGKPISHQVDVGAGY